VQISIPRHAPSFRIVVPARWSKTAGDGTLKIPTATATTTVVAAAAAAAAIPHDSLDRLQLTSSAGMLCHSVMLTSSIGEDGFRWGAGLPLSLIQQCRQASALGKPNRCDFRHGWVATSPTLLTSAHQSFMRDASQTGRGNLSPTAMQHNHA